MRLAVAATAPFGARVLEVIAGFEQVDLLVTRPDRPKGRGRRVQSPPAKQTAERLGIPIVQQDRLVDVEIGADVVIVAAYGVLIPDQLLERHLWLNVHPSLLPRWRGAAPVERAIMAGDTETGVTIHRTTAELDAGPIAAQETVPVGVDDDAGVVYERCSVVAGRLLQGLLGERGPTEITFEEQSTDGVTYAEKIMAVDRELEWTQPADEILNRIRALSPHIGASGMVDGRRLIVWRARLARDDAGLRLGEVELLEVQPEGRRRMSAQEYMRGLRGSQ